MSKARSAASFSRPAAGDLAILAASPELPLGAAASPPAWIRIAPAGELRCRDGRIYTLDPKALVDRFRAEKVEIPVDLGHATVQSTSAPALAWIDELEARADGLWGRVREWLQGGRDVLKARTHRYVSPAFKHDDKGAATWLHSVALVAAPALSMGALLAAGRHRAEPGDVSDFAAALGLDADATRATCLAAVSDLATGAIPLLVHEAVVAQLAATTTELRQLQAARRAEKVEALVTDALKALKIVPAEQAYYVELAATDAGLRTVERLFASMTPKIGPSVLEGRKADAARSQASAASLAAATNDLLRQRREKGLSEIGYADAMLRVVNGQTGD